MTLNESKIVKEIRTCIEKKYFYDAISLLNRYYGSLSADSYNSTLCELLFNFCFALGVQGAYMTKKTYELLVKLPMYRNIKAQTPFMARTLSIYNRVKNNQKTLTL